MYINTASLAPMANLMSIYVYYQHSYIAKYMSINLRIVKSFRLGMVSSMTCFRHVKTTPLRMIRLNNDPGSLTLTDHNTVMLRGVGG